MTYIDIELIESDVVKARTLELKINPAIGNFDIEHLKELNRRLFQDLPEIWIDKYKPGQFCQPVPIWHIWNKRRVLTKSGLK